jgi:hypothetical protein
MNQGIGSAQGPAIGRENPHPVKRSIGGEAQPFTNPWSLEWADLAAQAIEEVLEPPSRFRADAAFGVVEGPIVQVCGFHIFQSLLKVQKNREFVK